MNLSNPNLPLDDIMNKSEFIKFAKEYEFDRITKEYPMIHFIAACTYWIQTIHSCHLDDTELDWILDQIIEDWYEGEALHIWYDRITKPTP